MVGRVPALDGVRGVAIALVVLTHLGVISDGFYGVDVFFVLSGFLITGILLREVDRGGIRYRRFYARRVRRLGPALVVMLLLVAALGFPSNPAEPHVSYATGALAVVFYVANYLPSIAGLPLGTLNHTWSLAVEEQFYMLWPATFGRLARHRHALAAILLAAAAVMAFRWLPGMYERLGVFSYYWTPLRADGLLLGAALAVLAHRRPLPRLAGRAGWAGVATVALTVALLGGGNLWTDAFRYGYALVSLGTVVVLASLAAAPHGLLARLLAFRPLAGLGRVSYGLYLYHVPFVYFAVEHHWNGAGAKVLVAAAALATTLLSWFFLERPLLTSPARAEDRARDSGALEAAPEAGAST